MTNTGNRRRICIVVSDFMTVQAFLQDQIRKLSEMYEVVVVANTDDTSSLRRLNLNAELLPVPVPRNLDLWRDARALVSLYSLFRKQKFALVHSVTPKAGLLSMAAGKLAGIPNRIHTFTGQVWVTRSGLMRCLLKSADKLIALCATRVLVDSKSQLEFLVGENVVDMQKAQVLANGSISGVDTSRFRPDAEARRRVREELSTPEAASVFLFVGRLNLDKGVLDLAKAFAQISPRNPSAYLLFVGPDEGGMEARIRTLCSLSGGHLHFVGPTRIPEQYLAAADVLCLPSYREGFGSVVIEAAAVGIPAIASRIYGLIDAVQDGITGCLHQPGNVDELAAAMESLSANRPLRERLGMQARMRANQDFAVQTLTAALLAFYAEQLFVAGSEIKKPAWAKRAFDLLVAIGALVVLSPVLAAIAVVVRLFLGSPIYFRQWRTGLHGQLFTCLKFRTMTDARDAIGKLLPDAQRLTPLGRFLRSASLDELPELFNVIRGEMSLVGPRPLLPQYLNRYSPDQMRRHEVKPGITGWAQVNGRNTLDWNRRFELDLWYVDHWSLWMDLKILARTASQVLTCVGISRPGHATMPEFMGVSTEREQGNA